MNKNMKRILLTMVAAILLVIMSVAGTLAWLVDTSDTVINTFTVGKVEITLDEAKVDVNGNVIADADRVTENTYKLMPGHLYTKDPIVHISETSEESWLFVKVVNGIAAIEAQLDVPADTENGIPGFSSTIAAQMKDVFGWTLIDEDNGIWAYKETVTAGDNIQVFGSFKISDAVLNGSSTDEGALADELYIGDYDGAKITVQAYAVQADGISSAAEAWTNAPLAAWLPASTNP